MRVFKEEAEIRSLEAGHHPRFQFLKTAQNLSLVGRSWANAWTIVRP
jgi:hypothetical protein